MKSILSKPIIILPALLIIWSSCLYAQNKKLQFERIGLEEGLSQNTVNRILQDPKGFIWLATQEGLNRFNGYSFDIHKNDPSDPNSLSNSNINDICIDHRGILWAATENGLNEYDSALERFTRYFKEQGNPNSLSDNSVLCLHASPAGELWIGTEEGGLICLDLNTGKFTRYRNRLDDLDSLSDNSVLCIYESPSGELWIGTREGGLNRFDRTLRKFTRFIHDPADEGSLNDNTVTCIHESPSGELWVGTRNGGLNRLDRESGRFIQYRHEHGNPRNLAHNYVYSLYEGDDRTLWIGTRGGGLSLLDYENNIITNYRNEPGNFRSLSDNRVYCFFEDPSGLLWIGTDGGGISLYNLKKKPFFTYRNEPEDSNSLVGNVLWAIFEDRSGMIWIGTDGSGLTRFDPKTGRFKLFQNIPGNPDSLSHDDVRAIWEDDQGFLWIGTWGGGLNRFDRRRGVFRHYRHDLYDSDSLSNDDVRRVLQDSTGVLWVGTRVGLNRLDQDTGGFHVYKHDPDNDNSLSHNYVQIIYEDRENNLWIGTDAGGLNLYDRDNDRFVRFRNIPGDPDSLSHDSVLSIYEDSQARLWIGTWGGGLCLFDREAQRFENFTEEHGLSNNVVYGILEDSNGHLWMSTNNGLSRFDPRKRVFRNYNVKDGLQSNEFNSGAYLKARDGKMYFGGINGFNVFKPEDIEDNTYIPPIVITDFQISHESVPVGKFSDGHTYLYRTISETDEIRIPPGVRVFSIEFAALNYISPDKNEYAYRMKGLEEDWNFVGTRNYATYTGLTPGQYTFQVKGSNDDGIWNEEGTGVKIHILPPFWSTLWFRAGAVLVVLLAFFVILQLRTRSIVQRSRELEERVENRTAELREANIELRQEINVRKLMEERAERRTAQTDLIYKIGQRVSSKLQLNTLLSEIVESVRDAFDYYGVMLLLMDEKTKKLALQSIAGEYSDVFPENLSLNLGEGLIGRAAEIGETQFSNDVSKDPYYVKKVEENTKSELAVPIKSGDNVIGILDIQSNKLNDFDSTDVAAMETLSTQISIAIDNARLYGQAQQEISERRRIEQALRKSEKQIRFSLKEKEVLLKEIHHRVKNNMQIISSLLRLQSGKIEDKKALMMFKESQSRIISMALIHEMLYQSEDLAKIEFDTYVKRLVRNLFSMFSSEIGQVDLDQKISDVYLDINKAIPCGLIISELVSNSLKHAFPDKGNGTIKIHMVKEDGGKFKLIVEDDGAGFQEPFDFGETKSLGMRLIEGLVKQIGGTIRLKKGKGAKFIIQF